MPHSSCIIIVAKPLGSHNHRRKNPSSEKFSDEIFRQPLLRRVDTLPGSPKPKLLARAKISSIRFLTRKPTHRRVRARDRFSGPWTSPPESPAFDLLAYLPGFLLKHLNLHFFLCFVSGSCTFMGFLDFSDTQQHLQDFGSCFAPSSPLFHPSNLL